ncbi:MAG: ABC transporter ATP-binding protein [Desulfobacteraceae bacterium]|jgi:putative ABC transport system ATP-binding protein|nr:MAG: ABC transporter ATP-binding protein [Desulfobacteraceae bacterium]
MNNGSVIELENVSKDYRRGSETVHALRDVSLAVTPGEYVAVVGHSGSGKTTLMNIMGCLDRPSRGRVILDGQEVHEKTEAGLTRLRRSAIGFVFQQFFLIPTLSVLENVSLPSLFVGKPSNGRAGELLEMVGLGNRLHHLPNQLSGGEMQRVAIARSLINAPPILLADEPTGNLDSRNADMIMKIFEQLNQEGVTVVVVTHNQDIVKRCRRKVHIEDGRIET